VSKTNHNLMLRIVSAFILLGLAYACLYQSSPLIGLWFFKIVLIAAVIEWILMVRHIRVHTAKYIIYFICGITYIYCGIKGIYILYLNNTMLFTFIMLSIFLSDTAAYFIGRTLQGPKLAPKISPGKTWSGAIGAYLSVTAFSLILQHCHALSFHHMILLIALCPIGQAGDLIESYIKRQVGVKDSSNILPGHGGILDRLDSVLLIGISLLLLL